MKRCSKCAKVQDALCFGKNKANTDGLQSQCRSCRSAYQKNWYTENHETQKERVKKARTSPARLEVLETIKQAKNKHCTDCEQKYPYYVMDFDHLPEHTKLKNISSWKGSLESLKVEIDKCDVVCSNCHRERTHQRRMVK